jgi:branched-chain amino acid transport system permease protein
MWWVIAKTRFGMWVRAGASNREMVAALGINVKLLFGLVFAIGAALAGLAGAIAAPVNSVYPGMGESVLILCFVVVVIGGVGSVKGAFLGAILIGLADTFGKVLVPDFASFSVYAVMAAVLLWKPRGLFA